MKKYFSIILIFMCHFSNAQRTISFEDSIKYIQDYYSSFSTGYDFNGKYVVLSDNYKAAFSDTIITLTFDIVDEKKGIQNQTITINLKDVVSIEPNGTDVVEIFVNEPLIVPICGKLAFKTATESYEINIYYEVDEDVEQTDIYKTFETIRKSYQKN